MNKCKILIYLFMLLLISLACTQSVFARCEGDKVISDFEEVEPNHTFALAKLIPLTQGTCTTVIGDAGPNDSEYYGDKLCLVTGKEDLDIGMGGSCNFKAVVSDLYQINISEDSIVKILVKDREDDLNIGFVVFKSNGDIFSDFHNRKGFRFLPGTYYIGIAATTKPGSYFINVELEPEPLLVFDNTSPNKITLNNTNINRGIELTLYKLNFSSETPIECQIISSNKNVKAKYSGLSTTIEWLEGFRGFYDETNKIKVKVDKRYAKSLIRKRQSANVTINVSCTNSLQAEYPILLTRF